MSRSIVNNDESENANNPTPTGPIIQMVDARQADRRTRRQAILGGLAGLVAGGLAGLGWLKWPTAVTWAGDVTPQEAHARVLAARRQATGAAANATNTAAANERTRINNELLNQGGASLENAKQAAEKTAASVTALVVPLAQTARGRDSDGTLALQDFISSIGDAQAVLQQHNVSIPDLETIRQLFMSWNANLSQLPIDLNAYADAATSSSFPDAQTYLTALEAAVNGHTL